MNEEREKVLEMLADGQITVEQANELLEALSANLVSQQEQRFDRGLDPDKVLSTGFKNLSLDEIVSAKIHGIDGDYIRELAEIGFTNLSLDEVVSAKIHGIDGDYIRELSKAGFTNLSLDEVVSAKIHGVDQIYINALRQGSF